MGFLSYVGAIVVLLAVSTGFLLRAGNCPSTTPLSCCFFKMCPPPNPVHGHVAPGFEKVRETFERHHAAGFELGSSFVVYHKGEKVVHLWGGWKDFSRNEEYEQDSVQVVFSSTKVITSLAVAMLADRGLLSYDDPVAKHWPEFGCNGKENIKVSDIMRHRSGLWALEDSACPTWAMLQDPHSPEYEEFLAKSKPMSDKIGYHGLSRAMYISVLLRKVDPQGRSLREFVAEEIVKPLNIDFSIGLTDSQQTLHNKRVNMTEASPLFALTFVLPRFFAPPELKSSLYDLSLDFYSEVEQEMFRDLMTNQDSVMMRSLHWIPNYNKGDSFAELANTKDYIKSEFGSANGITNALSIAKIMSVLAQGGEANGVKLLSEQHLNQLLADLKERESDFDPMLKQKVRFSDNGWSDMFVPGAFGWAGAGGSVAQFDPKRQAGFGYAMNHMYSYSRGRDLVSAAQQAIDGLKN